MTVALVIAAIGVLFTGFLGFVGSRRRSTGGLEDWTVGGRRFGAATLWFLQAGEVFTTFTFLGTAGLTFVAVGASAYAIPYIPLALLVMYYIGPRVWRMGKDKGYLTQADFLTDRYGSKLLGGVSAVVGVVALLPYLQLQMTGLGLIVQLVTGDAGARVPSILVAFAVTVVFVLRSGVHGVATAAYFKDVIMVVMLTVIAVAIPLHFHTGYSAASHHIAVHLPQTMGVPFGEYSGAWYFTSVLISVIGSAFLTLPHQWPALLSAKDEHSLRRNYVYLPIYNLLACIPMIIALVGVVVLKKSADGDSVLLQLSAQSIPSWAMGLLLTAAAATAMVPAAAITVAISSLVANNVAPARTESGRVRVNRITVVTVIGLAMLLSILRPDLLANLLLLTFSGLAQLAPAICFALARRVPVSRHGVLAGMVVGVAVVAVLTFASVGTAGVDPGLVGLAANLVVLGAVTGVERMRGAGSRPRPAPDAAETAALASEG
jgi:SSS family solute:Na+ symporter